MTVVVFAVSSYIFRESAHDVLDIAHSNCPFNNAQQSKHSTNPTIQQNMKRIDKKGSYNHFFFIRYRNLRSARCKF
jgi:hypothetical protein